MISDTSTLSAEHLYIHTFEHTMLLCHLDTIIDKFYSSAIVRSMKIASLDFYFNSVCHVIPRLFSVLWSRSVKSRWKTGGWQTHKGEE